jgi:hypothetical protein
LKPTEKAPRTPSLIRFVTSPAALEIRAVISKPFLLTPISFTLNEDVSNVRALQPELRDQASYYATLVNGGIMSPNEAREALRLEKIDGFDEPRVPANIAGSAANPEQGGRPEETPPAEEE